MTTETTTNDISSAPESDEQPFDQSPNGAGLPTLPFKVGPKRAVDDELFSELAGVAQDAGCELLHVGRSGSALQLIIDHAEGVTIDHCADVSRQVGAVLDALDYGSGRYTLEVSSPGLDREFYSLADYEKYVGEKVKVVHRAGGRKASLQGVLESFNPETLLLEITEFQTGANHQISLRDIQSTRLEIDLDI